MKTNVPWLRAITVLALVLCMAAPAMATYNSTYNVLDDFPQWTDGYGVRAVDSNYTQYNPQNASATHARAGDLAIAVAKVVKWWRYPEIATGTVQYSDYGNITQYDVNLAASATGRPYSFGSMENSWTGSSAPGNQTIARLITDAAYAVQTRFYGNSSADLGSGAYMATYFKFPTPTSISASTYADAEAWTSAFGSELSSNYTGRGSGAPAIIRLTPYDSNQSNFTQYNGSYVAVVTGWRDDTTDPMVRLNFADGTERWTTLDNSTYDAAAAGSWAIKTFGYAAQTAVTGIRPIYNTFYPISPLAGDVVKWDEGPFVFGDAGGRSCDWYNLKLTNGTTTNTAQWINATSAGCSDGVCTIYADQYAVAAPGNWTWSVTAWCSNDSTNWYQVNPSYANAETYNAALPDDPVLTSPIARYSSYESAPNFKWEFTEGITWYNVKVYDRDTAQIIDAWLSNSSICSSQTSCTASWAALKSNSSLSAEPDDFPEGTFEWEVGGWGIGMADYTKARYCYNPDLPGNVQNITVGPTANNGTTFVASAFPRIVWNKSTPGTGQAWYDLWVGTPSTASSWREQWIGSPENYCNSSACAYKHWIPVNGEYQVWFNYWYNNSGTWERSGWSYGNFSAYPGPPSGVGISAPVSETQITGFQPNFKWNIDQNASWQAIGLYKDGSSSPLACSPTSACASGLYWMGTADFNGSYAFANSSVFQNAGLAGGSYVWKIQAWGSGDADVLTFTMGNFTVTSNPSNRSVPTAPANGSTQSGAVAFGWTGGNSTWYGVYWSGPASGNYWVSENEACGGVGGTSCSVTVASGNFTASGNYTWYVAGWGPNDSSTVNSASMIFAH